MRISINTSSFSFRFIGTVLVGVSVVIFLSGYVTISIILLLISILLIFQSNTYLIPKRSMQVMRQIEITLESFSISFQKADNDIITKALKIKLINLGLWTLLRFRSEKEYTDKARYLASMLVKYQRYIKN